MKKSLNLPDSLELIETPIIQHCIEELKKTSIELADVVYECFSDKWHPYVFHLLRSNQKEDDREEQCDKTGISWNVSNCIIANLVNHRMHQLPLNPMQKIIFQMQLLGSYGPQDIHVEAGDIMPYMKGLKGDMLRLFSDGFDADLDYFLTRNIELFECFGLEDDQVHQFDFKFNIKRGRHESTQQWRKRAATAYHNQLNNGSAPDCSGDLLPQNRPLKNKTKSPAAPCSRSVI